MTRSRSEQFDELVLDAVGRLERRWPDELRNVEVTVEEVPPGESAVGQGRFGVPLGESAPPVAGRAARIIVYRRPVESRAADPRSRAALVHDVVVERVADLLGLSPEEVDPDYGSDAPGGGSRD